MTKLRSARVRDSIDGARRRLGDVENALLDDLLGARIDRRVFLRHATRLGVGLPLLRALCAGVGIESAPRRAAAEGPPGGLVKAAVAMPHGAIDPIRVNDSGSYQLIFQVAEFLCVTEPDLTLRPVLAESWSHNEDGSVWTFKLRRGVKFRSGEELRADDVVASFDRLSDPGNVSNALSVFKGLLSKGGTEK